MLGTDRYYSGLLTRFEKMHKGKQPQESVKKPCTFLFTVIHGEKQRAWAGGRSTLKCILLM